MTLHDHDHEVRGALTRSIARLARAPGIADLAAELGLSVREVEASLHRLHDEHALLLHPNSSDPWVVHPFALSPGSCWVQAGQIGYWANCLYCAFGIAATLSSDATIFTRIGGESEAVRYEIRNGCPAPTSDVFHLSTPVAKWWNNVIHACASFQPFRSIDEIDPWCRRHAMPQGATMSIPALWAFAQDWYGSYLQKPWRKRSVEQAQQLFRKHGLTSEFWKLP